MSAEADNLPASFVQVAGETISDVLIKLYYKIWKTDKWQTPWNQSLVILHSMIRANYSSARNTEPMGLISYSNKSHAESLIE